MLQGRNFNGDDKLNVFVAVTMTNISLKVVHMRHCSTHQFSPQHSLLIKNRPVATCGIARINFLCNICCVQNRQQMSYYAHQFSPLHLLR